MTARDDRAEGLAARALHDYGLCVEVHSTEGAHDEHRAACHRFAAALGPVLDQARAETLRQAADNGPSSTSTDQLWRMWLRRRADQITATEEDR